MVRDFFSLHEADMKTLADGVEREKAAYRTASEAASRITKESMSASLGPLISQTKAELSRIEDAGKKLWSEERFVEIVRAELEAKTLEFQPLIDALRAQEDKKASKVVYG